MIKRILDSRQPVIIYNPPKVFSIDYFRECYLSGALPVFDTEFFSNSDVISILEKTSAEDILFGIRLKADNHELIDHLKNNEILNLDAVIFHYNNHEELDSLEFDNPNYKVLIEVIDIDINDRLEKLLPHGLILKGNEAPGKVSRFTSMILLQYYLEKTGFPVIIHGGVGFHTAPGIFAAGASGIVLDNQLYLTDEAPLSDNFKEVISSLNESDTQIIGDSLNRQYRFFAKLGTKVVKDLKEEESHLKGDSDHNKKLYAIINEKSEALDNGSADTLQSLFYLGQDSVFSKHFIKETKSLRSIIRNLFLSTGEALENIDKYDPLVAGSELAREHNTKYPIVQGPMANINDNPGFAKKVYEAGGLPFFAMGNLPEDLADNVLKEGSELFGNFGAGLIGTPDINRFFEGHLKSVKKYGVKYALIAVGIPSYVNKLESEGTKTYLHTPAIQMLENAIKNNCNRFIFEGKEAGGHIGTLTSFVLWEIGIEKLINESLDVLSDKSVLFAGGIASKTGSYFISGMSSNLAKRGVKVGIQVGTPYLLTEEILETGALKKLYQDLLIERNITTVIGKTVGLSTRTVVSPFSEKMLEKEYQMIKDRVPLSERKEYFEGRNVGSLLIAAKAFTPDFKKLKESGKLEYIKFSDNDHYEKGNFHTGESIAFFENQIKIDDVHHAFFNEKKNLITNLNMLEIFSGEKNEISDEIAVVGMACTFPDADSPETFWENIISKKYSIREVPEERFDHSFYYSDDRNEEDKTYSKIAGVIDYFEFDPKKYGYKKKEAKHLSRSQQMILDTAMKAVDNAGYLKEKNLPKDKTSVIIGTCLGNEFGDDMFLFIYHPEIRYHLEQNDEFMKLSESQRELILDELKKGMAKGYNPKLPDGAALNIEASRIAKHLELEGINYTIDAACATSLAALDNAKRELLSRESDAVIFGGIHTNLGPETFVGFAKMGALSAKGSFPFDDRAGGFVLGEGAGVMVLKRMKDAIRDGDTIHGVIKGIGSSSDGKGKAIAAPKPEGQGYAVKRAFEDVKGDITPEDVGFIEAHGTATLMGDSTEIKNLLSNYTSSSPIGISSIKSQIGHLLGGAGAAGLIKAILALKNKTLPPNGQFETPSTKFSLDNTPFFVVKDATEWKVDEGKTRIAGVSSFGFGGINYHVLVEEFSDSYRPVKREIFKDPDYDFNDDRIVIAGLGVVLPGANNIDEFWKNLESGKNVLTEIPDSRFHNDYYTREKESILHLPKIKAGVVNDYKFNNLKYKIPPSILNSIDRVQCFAIDSATQAIEQAGIKESFVNGNNTGIIIGTSSGEKHNEHIFRTRIPFIKMLINSVQGIDPGSLVKISDGLETSLKERYFKNTEDTIPGLLSNIVSGRIANFYNANGANYTIEAECASSAVGISLAIRTLRSKKADFMIAGGADANLAPANLMAYQMIKVLSPGENKIFDNTSTGVIMSEGAAIMLLTTYKKARETGMDIIGEISDFSWRAFPHVNFLAPTTDGFTKTVDRFYDRNQLSRKQVDYIDVFASSHPVVDAWERDALEKSFVKDIYFGNIKPETGYFRSANPAVVLTKLALMAKHRKILPNYSFSEKDTIISKDSIIKAASWSIDLGDRDSINLAANFTSLGGNHAHTVIRTLPSRFSKTGAKALPETSAAVAQKAAPVPAASGRGKVAALLSGQGAQHAGMMKELYDKYTDIRELMERGETIFREARGYSLLEMMFGDNKALNSTENTQPAVFLSSAAIYSYLEKKGFSPDYMIGHSVGEFTALYCSGILGFEDALRLILKRSEMMKQASETVPGSIMVALASPEDVEKLIRESGLGNVYVANKNSENQTAVSGGVEEIDKFCSFLKDKNVQFKKLDLSGAFHTPLFATAAEGLKSYIKDVPFNAVDYSRVISNVTARSYPEKAEAIKELLVKQLVSPVEFIQSVENLSKLGVKHFIEIGPNKILTNLLRRINIENYGSIPSVDPKRGQLESFEKFNGYLEENSIISGKKPVEAIPVPRAVAETGALKAEISVPAGDDPGFNRFLKENSDHVNNLLYREYQYNKALQMMESLDRFNFYTGKVVISGVSIGLPGKGRHVFENDNFERILSGENCIDPLSEKDKENILKKNITRIFKQPDGSARFQDITSTDEVIHLAGQLGYFDLEKDYGIDYSYDITYDLAIAAGIEALKDAGIPLVMNYQKTTTGSIIQKGYSLPEEMQEGTGVIFSSVFSSYDTLINEMQVYNKDQFYNKVYKDYESLYYFLMEKVTDAQIKERVTEWFINLKEEVKDHKEYKYDRNLLMNLIHMGSQFFAQYIKAKGPNTQVNAACATTTQAAGIAEDWIRTGRCERVIIVGGEAPTTEGMNEWITAGFLAVGAATVKKTVKDAAKPFDKNRNGMIVGSGAVALIIEREDCVKERGFNGQAELLGTYFKNSAFHPTRLDVNHISIEMKHFMESMKRAHSIEDNYADSLLFMSHETYTPARGGSADAEISALQKTFPDNYKNILITNTKGYTGHLLGVAIEDAILIKSLQMGIAPPIANLTDIPDHFQGLKFSRGEKNNYKYGLHFSAGFGSQFAMMFVRRIEENSRKNNPAYTAWLQRITGIENPQLKIINRTLCTDSDPSASSTPLREIPAAAVKVEAAPAPSAPVSPSAAGADTSAILKKVQDIIASQTGYTVDMLEEGLDLEADLGIDTVKQVEIFGIITSEYSLEVPEDLKLSELNTIKRIVGYIGDRVTVTAPPASPAAGADTSAILKKVQEIISSQTGYSVDMLEEGLDLEADLGIDTVKQVEIFGIITSEYSLEVPEDLKLSELNTIKRIVGYIGDRVAVTAPAVSPAGEVADMVHTPTEMTETEDESKSISRFAVEAVKVERASEETNIFEKRTILISPDKQGFADKLIIEIEKRNGKAVTIGNRKEHNIKCDLSKPEDVEKTVKLLLREHPDISGFIHLFPLDNYFGKRTVNEKEINSSVKSMFLITKGLHEKLNSPGSLVSSLSFDSVVFPYTGRDTDIHPLFAGIGGMMKTINKEFRDTLVKIVDFSYDDPKKSSGEIIDLYVNELLSGDTRVETGYHNNEKYVISLKKKSLVKGENMVKPGDTLLVTGGARGITFEILKEVVKRNREISLILLGRSDIDDIPGEYLAESADEQFIFKSLKEKMKGAKPLEIRKATEKVLNNKQARANLEYLRSQGVDTRYHAVDVLDRKALDSVLSEYGKIDGVIHAAGVEISNSINNKELRIFNLVFDTKITGLMNLLEVLKERDYRFIIGFSSVAAKFGNEGQIDYSGGNDMLGKMIIRESIAKGKTVKIFDWTAWKDIGMATNETVMKFLTEHGVELLPVTAGVNFFADELNDSSTREVLIANIMHEFDPNGIFPGGSKKLDSTRYPFLGEKIEEDGDSVVYNRVLDIKKDRFLLHHVIEEVPLFLGSTGVETMAEAAATLAGRGNRVSEVSEFEIPYGIKILKGRPKEIMIEAEKDSYQDNQFRCTITSQFRNKSGDAMGDPTLHYRGTYRFSPDKQEEIKVTIPKLPSLKYEGNVDDLMYHPRRLFMDDLFKTIDDILAFDGKTLLTRFHNRSSNKYFNHIKDPVLQTDAILVDGMFQTGGLLEFLSTDEVVLPYRIGSLKFHRNVNTNDEYLCITEKSSSNENTNKYQLKLIDNDGNLYISVKDFEMIRVGKLSEEHQIKNKVKILEDAYVN